MTQETKNIENKTSKTSNTENKIPKPNIALKNFKFNTRKKRICFFPQQEIIPDYKDTNIIGKFIAPNKQLISARKTGTTAKNQRLLSTAIKRARFLGLLPYTINHKGVDGNWMVS